LDESEEFSLSELVCVYSDKVESLEQVVGLFSREHGFSDHIGAEVGRGVAVLEDASGINLHWSTETQAAVWAADGDTNDFFGRLGVANVEEQLGRLGEAVNDGGETRVSFSARCAELSQGDAAALVIVGVIFHSASVADGHGAQESGRLENRAQFDRARGIGIGRAALSERSNLRPKSIAQSASNTCAKVARSAESWSAKVSMSAKVARSAKSSSSNWASSWPTSATAAAWCASTSREAPDTLIIRE